MSVEEDARMARVNSASALDQLEHYHLRMVERIDGLQWSIDNLPKDIALREAVKVLAVDMHVASTRPCSTCTAMTAALGEPFGCVRYATRGKT